MSPQTSCPTKLIFQYCIHPYSALINSGAEQSFVDEALAQKLGITVEPLPEVLQVAALNGAPLASISHRTTDLTLSLSSNHIEQISLFLFKATHTPLVLGYSWLKHHNPQIDWRKGRITGWSSQCHGQCLRSATASQMPTSQSSPDASPDLTTVPAEYHDLAQVFSKEKAKSLPPPIVHTIVG